VAELIAELAEPTAPEPSAGSVRCWPPGFALPVCIAESVPVTDGERGVIHMTHEAYVTR
jgi:hypothetical protein